MQLFIHAGLKLKHVSKRAPGILIFDANIAYM